VVAETDATIVVHDAAFDKPKAVVGGAEFGVVSAVIAVVAVGGIIVEGERCAWHVVARVEVVTADTTGVVHTVVVAAAMVGVVGGAMVITVPGIAAGVSIVAAVEAAVAVVTW